MIKLDGWMRLAHEMVNQRACQFRFGRKINKNRIPSKAHLGGEWNVVIPHTL